MPIECSCLVGPSEFPNNRENNREFFFEHSKKPHGLRVFAISVHHNRELTGNSGAKMLILLELNDVFGIRHAD